MSVRSSRAPTLQSWDPGGNQIAIGRVRPDIWERPAKGHAWRHLISLPDVRNPVWDRVGRRLASQGYDSATDEFVWTIWDIASGQRKEHWQLPPAARLAWSPDGHTLALFGDRPALVLSDDGTSRDLTHEGSDLSVDWSSDGHLLVTAADNGTARVWDWQGQMELARIAHPAPLLAVGLSPKADHLATLTSEGVLRVWWPG